MAISPVPQAGAGNLPVLTRQYKHSQDGKAATRTASHVIAGHRRFHRITGIFNRRTETRFRERLSSRSAIVLDANSGKVLYAYNADSPRQPASTIKVLTALIAIERLHDHDRVIASRRAARMPRSKIYLKPGHPYQANDLINAVLLASANDASVALAEKIKGSESSFARLMTKTARQLGARNTVCKSASGLTRRGQHTTARDLATLFNYAMRNKDFANRMKRIKIRTSFGEVLWNHNKALWRIHGAEGGKTGYTFAARQTYVGKFEKKGKQLIVAIMGSETMWSDIRRLVHHGFAEERQLARIETATDKSTAQSRLTRLRNKLETDYAKNFHTVRILSENYKMAPQLSL